MTAAVQLIVAEKPSVGRDIARVLGARTRREGYIVGRGVWVSWCVGHLVELCEPHDYDPAWKSWSPRHLPILPAQFRVRPSRSGVKQWRVLAALMGDPAVAGVINACDAGREGELIFRYVYELARCTKPVRRLWISSLTETAIRAGMARLRPGGEFDDLAAAARCRSEADWLVGINATRALTGLARRAGGQALMSVGRVQTPTLALIVRREEAIEGFVSQPFWRVWATFACDDGQTYRGLWHRPAAADSQAGRGDSASVARPSPAPAAPVDRAATPADKREADRRARSRLASRAEAEAIAAAVRDQPGRIITASRKAERERPPLLFDLTSLQRTANRRFGMSAERTLATAQALYEKHKAITYPRTDSRHLTADMTDQLSDILGSLRA
ncbi:MAG: DNA topoisomerase, partial [Myxococcota bacterium]